MHPSVGALRVLRVEWRKPTQALKASKVAIERADGGAVLDSESGKMSIGDKGPTGVTVDGEGAQDTRVLRARLGHPGVRVSQPVFDVVTRARRCERHSEQCRVRGDPLKRQQTNPREADPFSAAQSTIKP